MKFIIDFKNEATQTQIDAYFAANSCVVDKTFSAFGHVYLVDAPSQPAADALVDSIVEDTATVLNLLSMNWSTSSMDDWWKISSATKPDLNSPSVSYDRPTVNGIVYMVDSGIQVTHAEFANARISNLFSFNGNFTDFNGHGTALASVIVGETCGIVDAQVKSVKIFQDGTPTLLSDLLSAFDAIYVDGQTLPTTLKVVNLSWAIAKNSYVEAKIQRLIDLGYIVVASAGNNGSPIDNVTPASMDDVITVGAYNSDFEPCDFSNYTGYLQTTQGPVNYGALDVWAPGQDIRVASIASGTSMSAGTSISAAIHSAAILFNSQIMQLSDGSILSQVQNKQSLEALSVGRPGMLALSGIYADSTSSTSRILTEKSGQNGHVLFMPSTLTIRRNSGEALNGTHVISSLNAKSYSVNDLPSGVQIDNGFLLGSITVQQPTIFTSLLTYVDNADEERSMTLRFVVLPVGTILTSELAAELDITLNACSGNDCSGPCPPFTPECINCGFAKTVQCTCASIAVGCP